MFLVVSLVFLTKSSSAVDEEVVDEEAPLPVHTLLRRSARLSAQAPVQGPRRSTRIALQRQSNMRVIRVHRQRHYHRCRPYCNCRRSTCPCYLSRT